MNAALELSIASIITVLISVAAVAVASMYAAPAPDANTLYVVLPVRVAATADGTSVYIASWRATDCSSLRTRVLLLVVTPGLEVERVTVTTPAKLPYTPGYWYIPLCTTCRTVGVVTGSAALEGMYVSRDGVTFYPPPAEPRYLVEAGGFRLVSPVEEAYDAAGGAWRGLPEVMCLNVTPLSLAYVSTPLGAVMSRVASP